MSERWFQGASEDHAVVLDDPGGLILFRCPTPAVARLAAAAPDMFKALQRIIDVEHRRITCSGTGEPTLREIINSLDAGRAALAKATGQP